MNFVIRRHQEHWRMVYPGNPVTVVQDWGDWPYQIEDETGIIHAYAKTEMVSRGLREYLISGNDLFLKMLDVLGWGNSETSIKWIRRPIKDIYTKYFKDKPALDDLEKAHFAYHAKDTEHGAHRFFGAPWDHKGGQFPSEGFRQQPCIFCWRTRENVRWDELQPECNGRSEIPIGDVISAEERSFFALLNSGETRIPEILEKKFQGQLTAAALFYLQSTSGYPPDIVACFVDQDLEPLMEEFDRLMVEHQEKSGKFK